MNPDQNFDLVAIGDVASDAFIRLGDKAAEIKCEPDGHPCTITLPFADKVPYESATLVAAAGNAANVAVGAQKLGLRAALVANVGANRNGDDAIASLRAQGVETRWIERQEGKLTNYHYVLWYQDDRTILTKHEEYSYHLPFDFAQGKPPAWIYLSSLSEHSADFHHQIAAYLEAHPEIKLAFQPGTFQLKMGAETLAEIYQRTEVLFCNVGEAQKILSTDEENAESLLKSLAALGPKIVVMTDGVKGAYALENGAVYFMPPYPDQKPPLERTGAGDAFASAIVAALALNETLEKALAWGSVNAMSVVQQIGSQAGLLTREQIEKYLAESKLG